MSIHPGSHVFRTIFLTVLLPFCLSAQDQLNSLSALQSKLNAHIAQKKFDAAMWGVKVVSLDTGKLLFEHNPQKLFSPASNSKLYTAALGLDQLGPDYRIKTSLYSVTRPSKRGVLEGDLIVYGRGDPTISARLHGGDTFKALQPFVAALTNAGVKRIKGDLIGDDSYFRQPPYGGGWACDDLQYYYGAEISALTINDNYLPIVVKAGAQAGAPCSISITPPTDYLRFINQTVTSDQGARREITFHRPLGQNAIYIAGQLPVGGTNFTDDVTFHNPAGFFVACLKKALEKNGIQVSGKTRSMNWLERRTKPIDFSNVIELGAVESLPVRDLLREIQKPSQNLHTDLLLAHLGEQARTPQDQRVNSEDLGIRELNKFLSKAGVGSSETLFEEGSGLSRNNITTPNATIKLLTYMNGHQWADVYRDALPIAGVDGTLRSRMKGTAAAGNIRAKTGTLRWSNALSGYMTTAAGEQLVFSIMLNRYNNTDDQRSSRQELDEIAVALANFRGRSDASQ